MDRLVVVRDGDEALDFLRGKGRYATRSEGATPSVVLLDIRMPKRDGYSVLQEIRADKATSHLPVVMFSSVEEPGAVDKCYQLGANSYIQKPVDATQYQDIIRQVGTYWLAINGPSGPSGRSTKPGRPR